MFSANFGRPKSAASFKRFRLEEETDNEEYITENIKVQDNNIYFFGPVDMQNMLELTINIDILTKQLQIFVFWSIYFYFLGNLIYNKFF